MEFEKYRGGEDLEGDYKYKTMIRVYYIKITLFSIKIKGEK